MKITFFKHRLFGQSEKIQIPKDIPIPEYRDIDDILTSIKEGVWQDQVQRCRSLLLSGCKEAFDMNKSQLPVVMPCGLFTGQSISSLTIPTNIMVLDFDHFPQSIDEVQNIRNIIQSDPYTYVGFLSVSGFGLKVLIKLENDIDNISHSLYFQAIKDYYNSKYPGLMKMDIWDDSSKNINRLCYVSHDPEIYINHDSLIWSNRSLSVPNVSEYKSMKTEYEDGEVEKVIRYLEGGWQKYHPMVEGRRHDSTFHRAKELAEWGIDKEYAYLYFEQFMEEANDPADIKRQINNAYEKANFNSKQRKI